MKRRLGILGVFALGVIAAGAVWVRARPAVFESAPVPMDPIDAAWDVVHAAPRAPEPWVRLGDAQTAADQLEAAEHSYRTAIRLGGGDGLAYARLGFALYARGEDDAARTMLIEARRRGATTLMLDTTIAALTPPSAEPETVRTEEPHMARLPRDAGIVIDASVPEPTPTPVPEATRAPEPAPVVEPAYRHVRADVDRRCALPLNRGGTFFVPVDIDGVAANLIFDTGASITVLTADLAARIGLSLDPHRRLVAITANGRVEMGTGVVDSVSVADREVTGLRVAVCDDCVQGIADGLLGLDLVAALQMELDAANGVLRFADCE